MHMKWLALLSVIVLSACGDDAASTVDSGFPPPDGGTGTRDTGLPGRDSGPGFDAGPGMDAGSTDAGSETDGGADLDAGPMTDGGTVTLSNEPATCASLSYTFPDIGNGGHYAAARLTPPTFPFTVTEVRYTLVHNPGSCDADFAQEVLVFTGTGSTPPGTPAGETITVAAPSTPTAAGTDRVVTATLSTPVTVNTGEHLFVAVEMIRSGDTTCLRECLDDGVDDRNWWSAAASPPFPWRTLASYGNDGTLLIAARGR